MYECDERAARSLTGRFIYQPDAARFENIELCVEVGDRYAQVVYARAAFGNEPADGRLSTGGFEQFDATFADREHRYADALIFDDFDFVKLKPQAVAPELQGFIN